MGTDTDKNHKSQEQIQIKTTKVRNRYRWKPQKSGTDTVTFFNFESGRGEQDDYPPEQIDGLEVDTNDAER